jgi:UDP-glucose 4-epimerase
MKKNYLITGGAGFIGSRLVEYLKNRIVSIYIVDDLSTGSLSNIKRLPKNVKFINGDCADNKILKKLQKIKFDTIFHIAGQSSGEISFDSPTNDLNRNLLSTVKLAEFSLKNKVRKFIYASSMSVYGDLKEDRSHAKEKSKCNPLSFYGISKLTSENYLKIFSKLGLDITILRFFNVYGPNQNLKNLRQGMISIYLGQLLKSNTIIIKGSLKRFRDFIYIDDVIKIIDLCSSRKITKNKIYNISTGYKTSVKEILSLISQITKKKIKLVLKGSTPGDQFGIYAKPTLLKKDLKIKNLTSIKDGVKKMIESIKYD